MISNSFTSNQNFGDHSPGWTRGYVTAVVVENCRQSCETVAGLLAENDQRHLVMNDCVSAFDELSSAIARESRYCPRYAAWCIERCAEMTKLCESLEHAAARRCRRWCQLLMRELSREVVSLDKVKETFNRPVRFPWSE